MGQKSRKKRMRREGLIEAPQPKAVSHKPVAVDDASFERVVVKSEVPVLVDFWAPWCGPCKMIAPVLEEMAESLGDRLKIVKYNTQNHQGVAQAMRVRSIPTLMLFKDGQVADVRVGAANRAGLESWIDRHLSPKRSLFDRVFRKKAEEAAEAAAQV